jgi:hypothetical protein
MGSALEKDVPTRRTMTIAPKIQIFFISYTLLLHFSVEVFPKSPHPPFDRGGPERGLPIFVPETFVSQGMIRYHKL